MRWCNRSNMRLETRVSLVAPIRQLAADCTSVLRSVVGRSQGPAIGSARRVTFVQFGNYEEAFWRLERGGTEN